MHSPGAGCPALQPDTPGFQPSPWTCEWDSGPTAEPPPEPALLALQRPQRLHRHLFLASLQQQQRSAEPMRLSMDSPMPELQGGPQEQELRQLLNKDKSKRSKGGSGREEWEGHHFLRCPLFTWFCL
ncbi:histone deacetylase 7-like [Acomys russatus]|uniref:histone deacetylase 7-like n=1 Tax=Acomys russatus TaxID=60746 RepID=UPI0021E24945|nr:histone deacetylase 7-like [Acomys russatus]